MEIVAIIFVFAIAAALVSLAVLQPNPVAIGGAVFATLAALWMIAATAGRPRR